MKIGLVLSGGGFRGVAHIGAIKALEEYGLYPTYIAGTSSGAIVGSLYAYGYGFDEMLSFFRKINVLDIKKISLRKPGFIEPLKFYSHFKKFIIKDDFTSLNKRLFITATDLLSGKLKVFDQGELIRPVLASAAVPGVFAPVMINDSYYIDGGTLNNFPVGLLRSRCDFVIGVYVNGFVPVRIEDIRHSHNVIERAFKFRSVKEDLAKFKDCDIIVHPNELSKYGTFDKKNLNAIFNIGYNYTISAILNHKLNSSRSMVEFSLKK